jgi:hypothetical protein
MRAAPSLTVRRMKRLWTTLSESNLVQGLLLAGLFCVFPIQQFRSLMVMGDYDIWWHIRVGQWIIEHHAVPRQGLFSAIGATRPWVAYSWGFEVVMASLNGALGLMGILVFVVAFQMALVLALFLMTRSLSRSFWWAWLLSALAVWAMDVNVINLGRPTDFSILFFTLELVLIFKAQETRNVRYLYWLPLLFLVWANCHIQFVYGLVLLGLFAAVKSVDRLVTQHWPTEQDWADESRALRPAVLWAIFAACLAATLVNPYTVGLYRVIFELTQGTYVYSVITETLAPNFRKAPHYVQVLLMVAAFFATGRRKIDPYKLALLTVTSLVSFRSVRDVWFACIPAAAIIAWSVRRKETERDEWALNTGGLHLGPVLAGAVLMVVLSGVDNGISNRALVQTVQNSYPVDAVRFIQKHHFPGPLYNNFNWGGFLIGNLPDYPVSIDGRTNLYGDDYVQQAIETILGAPTNDYALNQANLVLLPSGVPLCERLQTLPQFKLVYRDNMATVFVRNP